MGVNSSLSAPVSGSRTISPAAAVAVGQVFGRIKLEILLGQFGVALGPLLVTQVALNASGGWSIPRTAVTVFESH